MTCRRICGELVEFFRFGGLDVRSAPHLDHLAECRVCRDEVGFDRALVQQLRAALRERIVDANPSPQVWPAILRRTQVSDRGLSAWFRGRSAFLLARLRVATSVSGMALALLVAVGTQVGLDQPSADRFTVEASAAGERFEQHPPLPGARPASMDLTATSPLSYVPPPAPRDLEAQMFASAILLPPTTGYEPAPSTAAGDRAEQSFFIRVLPPIDDASAASDASDASDDAAGEDQAEAAGSTEPWIPLSRPSGEPS